MTTRGVLPAASTESIRKISAAIGRETSDAFVARLSGPLRVMVVAGESSGDLLAAAAINALRERLATTDQALSVFGTGGAALRAAGVDVRFDLEQLAVMGLTEVLFAYPRLKRIQKRLIRLLDSERPDVLLLVDYVEFNLTVGEAARMRGIPVLFYVGPQLWAWRPNRIERIRRSVSAMAVLFKFEVALYKKAGIPVRYVGHPLTQRLLPDSTSVSSRALEAFVANDPLIGLMPGSRRSEIQRLWPVLLELAERLHRHEPTLRFAVPLADGTPTALRDRIDRDLQTRPYVLRIEGDEAARYVLARARAAVVASGTVTLEAAWLDCPMLVIYRVSALSYAILKRLIQIPNIALVNIVAGDRVVPEFLQSQARAENLVDPLNSILAKGPARDQQLAGLARVRDSLRAPDPAAAVADFLLETLAACRTPAPSA